MDIKALLRRAPIVPFAPGSRIPWHEPEFSERMLREHLSQSHDRASRRLDIVDRQVAWLHGSVMVGKPGRVLDLGCGPGLYTSRLAREGHQCVGIDFSPASIAYATAEAERDGLACDYRLDDLRAADLGSGFDAVLIWFGEFNTFSPAEADDLLSRVGGALSPGGKLVLELHDADYVRGIGEMPPHWSAAPAGLFSDAPHLTLRECQWHEGASAATERYVVYHEDRAPDTYAQSTQAYSDAELDEKLAAAGLTLVARYESIAADGDDESQDGHDESQDADLFGAVVQRTIDLAD